MPVFTLSDRSILRIAGPEAEHFLHNLVTTDVESLSQSDIVPGALLSPQGKILFDFLISRHDGAFCIDCLRDVATELAKRLKFYRLRAKVEISLEEQALVAIAFRVESTGSEVESGMVWLNDRRFPGMLGAVRGYGAIAGAVNSGTYELMRIENGIAEGGLDYELGDAFPHDVNLDQTGGVSFSKGCYVGQEVVSRMQHRGTARRRIVIAKGQSELAPRAEVTAGGRPIGTLGTARRRQALALIRLDKAKDAVDSGVPILAGAVPVSIELPPQATFGWPKTAGDDA